MTARQARERAHRGAKFLDEKLGRGWRRRIKRRHLDMRCGIYRPDSGLGDCGCVLAQLSDDGSYVDESYRLGINPFGTDGRSKAQRLGFSANSDADYAELTVAWRGELRAG